MQRNLPAQRATVNKNLSCMHVLYPHGVENELKAPS